MKQTHGTWGRALSLALIFGHFAAFARLNFTEISGHTNDDEANRQLSGFFTTLISKINFPAINGGLSDERPDEFLTAPAFTIPPSKRLHLCVFDTESLDYQICHTLSRDKCVPNESDRARCQWREGDGQSWCAPHTQALCEERLGRLKSPQDAFDTMPLSALDTIAPRSRRYAGIEDLDLLYEGHGPPAKALGNLAGYFARGIKSLKSLKATSHGCLSFQAEKYKDFAAGFAEAAIDPAASREERQRVKAIAVTAQANQLHSFYLTPEGKPEVYAPTADTPLTISLSWKWWGARAMAQVTKLYDCRSQSGSREGRRCTENDEKEKLKSRCYAKLPPPYSAENQYESCANHSQIKFWQLGLVLPKLPTQ